MSEPTPLVNACPSSLSSQDLEDILAQARSSSYIQEVTSGETPSEESGLWDTLALLPQSAYPNGSAEDVNTDDAKALEALVKHVSDALSEENPEGKSSRRAKQIEGKQFTLFALAVADERTKKDGSVLVVSVDVGKDAREKGKLVQDTLRVVPRSLIEVVSSLHHLVLGPALVLNNA